jgi:hypothetical protein
MTLGFAEETTPFRSKFPSFFLTKPAGHFGEINIH